MRGFFMYKSVLTIIFLYIFPLIAETLQVTVINTFYFSKTI